MTRYFLSVHGFERANYDIVEAEILDIEFRQNVKGTSTLPDAALTGTITAVVAGTAGKNVTKTSTPL